MSTRSMGLDDRLYDYLLDHSLNESPLARALREKTDARSDSAMRSSAEQMQFLALLLRLIGAMNVIEVGVFTGYGTLVMAQALPASGRLLALDITDRYISAGRAAWVEAGVAERIYFQIGPALESLDAAIHRGERDGFDFAYIDADKENYQHYFERCLTLVRPGGLIAVDNVLWGGKVADPQARDSATMALKSFNKALAADARVDLSMLPVGDGLSLARVR